MAPEKNPGGGRKGATDYRRHYSNAIYINTSPKRGAKVIESSGGQIIYRVSSASAATTRADMPLFAPSGHDLASSCTTYLSTISYVLEASFSMLCQCCTYFSLVCCRFSGDN